MKKFFLTFTFLFILGTLSLIFNSYSITSLESLRADASCACVVAPLQECIDELGYIYFGMEKVCN